MTHEDLNSDFNYEQTEESTENEHIPTREETIGAMVLWVIEFFQEVDNIKARLEALREPGYGPANAAVAGLGSELKFLLDNIVNMDLPIHIEKGLLYGSGAVELYKDIEWFCDPSNADEEIMLPQSPDNPDDFDSDYIMQLRYEMISRCFTNPL